MMYTASWEIVNEDRDDFGECDSCKFSTISEAEAWLNFRWKHNDYYCVIFNSEGHIVSTGWMA